MKKVFTIMASALLIGTSVAAVRSLSESTAIAEKDAGIQKLQASVPTNQMVAKATSNSDSKFIKTISFDLTGISQDNAYQDGYWEWDETLGEDVFHEYYIVDWLHLYEPQYDQAIRIDRAKWAPDGLILDKDCSLSINTIIDDYSSIKATFYCENMEGIDAEHPLSLNYNENKITYGENTITIEFAIVGDRDLDNMGLAVTDSDQSMKITHIDYEINLFRADYVTTTDDGSLIGFALRTVESDWLNLPRDEYACVYKIASENGSIIIPEKVSANGKEYRVISVGITEFGTIQEGYVDAWNRSLEIFDPSNVSKIVIPESAEFVYYNGRECPSTEIYIYGHAKAYLRCDNALPMHVDNRQAYDSYYDRDHSLFNYLVRDYSIQWKEINVKKPGTWAEEYIALAGDTWRAFEWIKINGQINETDLTHMQNLEMVERLDLSNTTLSYLPYNFLPNSAETIREIILPTTLKNIESSALEGRRNLSKINLENVKTIDSYAFIYTNLTEINLSSATLIGHEAFSNTPLSSIIWANDTKDLILDGYCFYNTQLTTLNIPAGLTSIPNDCFRDCSSLTDVVLPESVTQIGHSAFRGCRNLETISLPSTLAKVEDYAFNGCPNLTSIKCSAVMPPESGRDLAAGINTFNATLYVLPFVRDLYRNATGWNNFILVDELWEQVDKLFVNRPLDVEIGSEYDELLNNNPIVEIVSNGQLTISGNGTFSAGNFIIDSNLGLREDSNERRSATMINVADNMRANAVTTNLSLTSYNSQWFFLSFPYDVKVSDIVPDTNIQWVIRGYDASARANADFDNTWKNLDNDYVLEAGKGYIWASANTNDYYWDYREKHFTVPALNNANKNKIFATGDVKVKLEEIPAELAQNRSWNFIGNPYPAYYQVNTLKNFTAPITLWRGSSYYAFSPVDDDVILYPNEAFFVQCPTDNNTLTFAAEGRLHTDEAFNLDADLVSGLHAPQFIPMDGRNVFNFNVKGTNSEDRTRVVINPEAELGYQISCDAPKFFAEKAAGIEIYTSDGQVQYSINERPLSDGTVTMGIKALQGEYTISLNGKYNSEYTVLLTDMVSGNVVDLTSEDYTFIVNEDYQGDRFVISICTEVTGINQISSLIGAEENVTVTAINGVTLYKGQLSGFNTPNAGIYIINAGGNSYKAFLK